MNSDYDYEYDYEEIDTTTYTTSTEPSTTSVYTTKGFTYLLTVFLMLNISNKISNGNYLMNLN